jgi:hypothetical protein
VSNWLVIIVAAAVLLLATWHLAEWACRRLSARYAARLRLWQGPRPDGGSEGDSTSG